MRGLWRGICDSRNGVEDGLAGRIVQVDFPLHKIAQEVESHLISDVCRCSLRCAYLNR